MTVGGRPIVVLPYSNPGYLLKSIADLLFNGFISRRENIWAAREELTKDVTDNPVAELCYVPAVRRRYENSSVITVPVVWTQHPSAAPTDDCTVFVVIIPELARFDRLRF